MKLEITYTDGRATKVMLDGRQMDCCSMLDIHMEPGSLPVATLHVPVTELDINLLDSDVHLHVDQNVSETSLEATVRGVANRKVMESVKRRFWKLPFEGRSIVCAAAGHPYRRVLNRAAEEEHFAAIIQEIGVNKLASLIKDAAT